MTGLRFLALGKVLALFPIPRFLLLCTLHPTPWTLLFSTLHPTPYALLFYALLLFAEAAGAELVVLLGRAVAVLLGAEKAGAALVMDGLGLVLLQKLLRWGELVALRREDDAGDGTGDGVGRGGGSGIVIGGSGGGISGVRLFRAERQTCIP